VLSGRAFSRGQTLVVPIKRVRDPAIRTRNPVNQWNTLSMSIGSTLILACAAERPESCTPRAAIEIKSPNAQEVELVRRSYAIESSKADPGKALALVAPALSRPPDLLFMYALDFVVRRNALGRDQGAGLAAKALAHPSLPADSRFELGTSIATRSRFFDPARKADAANVAVVAGLAHGLVTEADAERRLDWMHYLGSLLLGEIAARPADADALRTQLVRSVRSPDPREVIKALQSLQGAAVAQDKETSVQLSELWRRAFGIR
jgi:hypothetical protein